MTEFKTTIAPDIQETARKLALIARVGHATVKMSGYIVGTKEIAAALHAERDAVSDRTLPILPAGVCVDIYSPRSANSVWYVRANMDNDPNEIDHKAWDKSPRAAVESAIAKISHGEGG